MGKEKELRFGEILREHAGLIARVCSLYARNRDDFSDLRQDILLQVWRSLDTFRGESKVSTWLYRVALNCAILNVRKSARSPFIKGNPGIESLAGAEEVPVFGPEDYQALHKAIRTLEELDRAIILLYLEEHSYAEIAEITGFNPGTVGVRIVRIKQKLRKSLEQLGYN